MHRVYCELTRFHFMVKMYVTMQYDTIGERYWLNHLVSEEMSSWQAPPIVYWGSIELLYWKPVVRLCWRTTFLNYVSYCCSLLVKRHLRTSMKSDPLDRQGKSNLSPSQRNPLCLKQLTHIVYGLVQATKRDKVSLFMSGYNLLTYGQ